MSEGPWATLNLGRRLGDAPEHVDENRRRLCAELGADSEQLALNYQRHSTTVNRAPVRDAEGDGLWTDEAGVPMLALGADCALVGLARQNGAGPAAAVVHAGRIGIIDGVLQAAVAALGGKVAAVIGPAIGPCCYEVGREVADPYRAAFGAGVVRDGKLNLWRAAELSLREAGATSIERLDLCTCCHEDLFFSYRRDGEPRGGHGVIALVS
ncbi:MAG: polyphenol oxidase family protein [Actinomycetota bacterium]|nr:polyphenol oxidase family protein [Actinomycetota bacterium]